METDISDMDPVPGAQTHSLNYPRKQLVVPPKRDAHIRLFPHRDFPPKELGVRTASDVPFWVIFGPGPKRVLKIHANPKASHRSQGPKSIYRGKRVFLNQLKEAVQHPQLACLLSHIQQ